MSLAMLWLALSLISKLSCKCSGSLAGRMTRASCTVLSVHVKQSLFVLVALAVCVFAADEAQDQEAAEQYFLRYG